MGLRLRHNQLPRTFPEQEDRDRWLTEGKGHFVWWRVPRAAGPEPGVEAWRRRCARTDAQGEAQLPAWPQVGQMRKRCCLGVQSTWCLRSKRDSTSWQRLE